MARVTVEDCIKKIPNRFELVLIAAKRAREIAGGSEITVSPDRDKNPIIAMREIAKGHIDKDALQREIINSMKKTFPSEGVFEPDLSDIEFDGAEDDSLLFSSADEVEEVHEEESEKIYDKYDAELAAIVEISLDSED